nr:hypothetical protein [Providencia sp. wls1943]
MPIESSTVKKTPFSQSKFLNFLTTDDAASFKENILKVSNSKERFGGFCFGASVKFLHYSDKGLEHEYINIYNKHLDNITANNPITNAKPSNIEMASVLHYKDYTEKKHEIKQGNKLLKEIFDIQKLQAESTLNNNLSLPISFLSSALAEQNFIKVIDLALDENVEKYCNKESRMQKIICAAVLDEKRKYIKNRYSIKKTDKLDEIFLCLNSNPGIRSRYRAINSLLDSSRIPTNAKTETAWVEKNKQQNLNSNIKIANKIRQTKKFNDFMSMIKACKDDTQNYLFSSPYHTCAINIKRNKETEKYEFFDPNEGLYECDSFDEFSLFLKNYMDENQEYEFIKDEKSDYQIAFVKLNRINQNSANYNENKGFDSNLKINKLLALDNFKVILKRTSLKSRVLKKKSDSIVHQSFNKKNHLVTLEFNYTKSNESKQKTIYSSNIDASDLHQVIRKNLAQLKQTDQNIFIDKKGNIYPIAPHISMANFHINTVPSDNFSPVTLNNNWALRSH